MRRTAVRVLVTAVVGVSLALSAAPIASASSLPPRIPSSIAAQLPPALRGAFRAGPPEPRGRLHSFAEFGGSFREPGSPYRWTVGVGSFNGGPFSLDIGAYSYHQTSGTLQRHDWFFSLPPSAVHLGPRLLHAHVDTGTTMGSFGKVDLTLHSFRRLHMHRSRCPKTHAVLFTGSLSFTPNEGTLPSLSASRLRGGADRFVQTHARCPQAGGPSSSPCRYSFRNHEVNLIDHAQHAVVSSSLRSTYLDANILRRVGPANESDEIEVSTTGPPVIASTGSGLTVDASTLAPLMSGSLAFKAGGTSRHRGEHGCAIRKTREIWSSGTLTLNFDTGAINLTGAGLHGNVFRVSRR